MSLKNLDTLFKNSWVKEEITTEITNYLVLNGEESIIYVFWGVPKLDFKGIFVKYAFITE